MTQQINGFYLHDQNIFILATFHSPSVNIIRQVVVR